MKSRAHIALAGSVERSADVQFANVFWRHLRIESGISQMTYKRSDDLILIYRLD